MDNALNEEIDRPKLTEEQIVYWISRLKNGNTDDEKYKQMLIDTFVNSVYLYDDKLIITYNFKDGTRTTTFDEIKAMRKKMCR